MSTEDSPSTEDRVLVDLVVHAHPDAVWEALRDPDVVHRWFGWDAEGLAAEIQEIFVTQPEASEGSAGDGEDGARVVTWPDGDRISVTPAEDGARLVVTRQDHRGADFDGVYDPIDEGWITFAHQLQFALERHPGVDRRTVSATGVDLGPDDDALLARLGLRPLGEASVGSPYVVERPDGTRFSGEVVFQADLQLGLSVAEEGDALLVIARTPPATAPPHGTAMFVLSTYGHDDDAFAATEDRWSYWWGSTP